MLIVILIIAATVLYTIFNLFVAKTGGAINDNLSAGIFNGLGGIIPLIIYFMIKSKGGVATTKHGVIYALLAGVTISAFSIILVNIFSKAANVSFVLPVIYGGTVVLGAIAGIVLFKESVSAIGLIGLGVTTVGLSLVVYSHLTA